MQFYVVLTDGRRFGPADTATLNQWIIEGRVGPSTILESAETGAACEARSVVGLDFPGHSASPPTQHEPPPVEEQPQSFSDSAYSTPPQPMSSYPRGAAMGGYDDGRNLLTWSFVCSFGSIPLCCCAPAAVAGIVLGVQAKQKGNANAKAAIIVAWIVMAIEVVYWIFSWSGALQAFDSGFPL